MRHPGGGQARDLAVALLLEFADETGLTSDRPPRRYLWTDAFAVCGFLGLHESTGDGRYRDLALTLVRQVHRTLGRHRADDARTGWISGLAEEEGAERPTAGGLRIGKSEPERPAGEPYHPEREWERDGQYYHYLTRWMHALDRVWRVTGDERYHRWAAELAGAATAAFVARGRMYWKMSIDLARPLVPSSGQHDPLDGRISIEALRASAPPGADRDTLLADAAAALDRLCRDASWVTHDALGVGGLLTDCLRLVQLRSLGRGLPHLEERVFEDARRGLGFYALRHRDDAPAATRLAFRELGLAIGLRAVERIPADDGVGANGLPAREWRRSVAAHADLAEAIETFWSIEEHRRAPAWTDHADINAVMLAVALAPGGYLAL